MNPTLICEQDITDLVNENEAIKTPAEPVSTRPAPAKTYTPYPNVLNPVEEPITSKPPCANLVVTQPMQQQQKAQPQNIHEAPSGSRYFSEPLQHNPFHSSPSTKQSYQPASHDDHDPEPDFSAYDDLFSSSGFEGIFFPGWFVTSFDEYDVLAAIGFKGGNAGAHRESAGQ